MHDFYKYLKTFCIYLWRKKNFHTLQNSSPGLRIKMAWDRVTEKRQNKSLITCKPPSCTRERPRKTEQPPEMAEATPEIPFQPKTTEIIIIITVGSGASQLWKGTRR